MYSVKAIVVALAVLSLGILVLAQHRQAPPGMFRDLDDEIAGKALLIHGKQLFIDDFVIEVNPRHVNYYRRLLCFEVLGQERPCPRVQGAPAVLLRVDLGFGDQEVERVGGSRQRGLPIKDRTLYPYFWHADSEESVTANLKRA